MKPVFSIIVPVYNVRPYLRACLESLIAAARIYGRPTEIICVDDGSNDGSGEILDAYADDGDCLLIEVLHQRNKGVSVARNAAMKISTGEYLCFVDADDLVEDDWLVKYAEAFEKYRCDLVRCDGRNAEVRCYGGQDLTEWAWKHFVREGYPWKYAIRRSVAMCARFPVGVAMSEDALYAAKILPFIESAVQLPGSSYRHVVRSGSAMFKALDSGERLRYMETLLDVAKSMSPVDRHRLSEMCAEGILAWLDRPKDLDRAKAIRRVWCKLRRMGCVKLASARLLFRLSYACYALTGLVWPSVFYARMIRWLVGLRAKLKK